MTERYSPYKLAIELGFTEEEAQTLDHAQADATNIRRVAEAKGLLKPKLAIPKNLLQPAVKLEPKLHSHYYRKDGSCSCGAKRKAKQPATE